MKSDQCSESSILQSNSDPYDQIDIEVVEVEPDRFSASVCFEMIAAEMIEAVRNGHAKSFKIDWNGGKYIKTQKVIEAVTVDDSFEFTIESQREIL